MTMQGPGQAPGRANVGAPTRPLPIAASGGRPPFPFLRGAAALAWLPSGIAPAFSRVMAMRKTKGLIRSRSRRGSASKKTHGAETRRGRPAEPTACDRCGAVFVRRSWHRTGSVSHALLARARWSTCPACEQTRADEYLGRVLVRGDGAHDADVRHRIANVAARAGTTQPERRVVSIERQGDTLEVLTTSQKLAHRIVHELRKLLGGRAAYRWSDDGSLFATLDV
jgi:hypothetical protein